MTSTVARVVLDTNACLDLFVFDDPGVQALRAALHGGLVVAIANDACRDEWLRVLDYPQLRLDAAARAAAMRAFDALVQPALEADAAPAPCRNGGAAAAGFPSGHAANHAADHAAGHAADHAADHAAEIVAECAAHRSAPGDAPRLPRCRDPDDQKFLELALTSGARWLVSRDAQVLALGRRTRREGWFEIVTPQAWRLE